MVRECSVAGEFTLALIDNPFLPNEFAIGSRAEQAGFHVIRYQDSVAPTLQRARLIVVVISGSSINALLSTYGNGWIVGLFPDNAHTGFPIAFGLGGGVLLLCALTSFALMHPGRTLARFDRIRSSMRESALSSG